MEQHPPQSISANEPDVGDRHQKQGVTSFDTRKVKFYDGENAYNVEFSIAKLLTGEKVAYAKKFYGRDAELTKKIQDAGTMGFTNTQMNPQTVSDKRIPQNSENVKKNFSNGTDVNYSMSSIANTFFGDENMSSVAFEQGDYKQTEGYKKLCGAMRKQLATVAHRL